MHFYIKNNFSKRFEYSSAFSQCYSTETLSNYLRLSNNFEIAYWSLLLKHQILDVLKTPTDSFMNYFNNESFNRKEISIEIASIVSLLLFTLSTFKVNVCLQ